VRLWLSTSLDPNVSWQIVGSVATSVISGLFTVAAALVQRRQDGQDQSDPDRLRRISRLRRAVSVGLAVVLISVLLTVVLLIRESVKDNGSQPTPGPDAAPTSSGPTATPAPSGALPDGNPYPPGHQTRVLDEPMIAENGRWSNFRPDNGTCRFAEDGLHVGANNYYHECYGTTSVQDFTYEVEFSFGTAKVAGIFFRQSGDGSWYWAMVGRSGKVWLSKGVNGAPVEPDLFTGSVAPLDPGQRHRLAVTGVGSQLTVYVDGERVGTVTDRQFTEGRIGVYTDGGRADGTGPSGETIFHHVRVWAP